MIIKTFQLRCDCCGDAYLDEGDESEDDLLSHALSLGWDFRKVPNGSIWDLCPKCSKLEQLPQHQSLDEMPDPT